MLDVDSIVETSHDTSEEVTGKTSKSLAIPGVLRGQVTLELHTIQAFQVFKGRRASEEKTNSIPGLNLFAKNLTVLSAGSRAGDPYADWFLVRVEKALDEAEDWLAKEQASLATMLEGIQGFTVENAQSLEPKVIELRYRSPHAYRAAGVIGLLDRYIVTLLTLNFLGLIERQIVGKRIGVYQRATRAAFYLAAMYQFTGIRRDDVRQKTAKAIEIAEKLGEVPTEIIEGTVRPRLSLISRASLPTGLLENDPLFDEPVGDPATLAEEQLSAADIIDQDSEFSS